MGNLLAFLIGQLAVGQFYQVIVYLVLHFVDGILTLPDALGNFGVIFREQFDRFSEIGLCQLAHIGNYDFTLRNG